MDEEKKEFKVPANENSADKKKMLYLFLITFVVVIILVSMFLKGISPSTELDFGESTVQTEQSDDTNIRAQIDQRLKMIQNDDDMPGVSEKNDMETPQEMVKRLKRENEEATKKDDKTEKDSDFSIDPVRVQMGDVPTGNSISRIYIGQFSDMQSAVNMQSAVLQSGLVESPQIKSVNGYYTIQAGAYLNYESAKGLATQLNNAGFSAKIVKEMR